MTTSVDTTVLVVFLLLAGALAIWILRAWWRTGYTFWQAFWYLTNEFFARVLWRTQFSGPLPVADNQGAVIVCNHNSGIDPLLIQLSTNRIVHWMVAREYYEAFFISLTFKALRSIPVNRGGIDTASTKQAIRLVQQGGLVGLFPEGRINDTKQLLLPGRPGAALIALKARAPVIPCFVYNAPYDGTTLGCFFMAAKARVIIGKPIDLSPYYDRDGDKSVLEELTKLFLVEIARLAGVEDFEPKLAGKHWKRGPEETNGQSSSNGAEAKPAERILSNPS